MIFLRTRDLRVLERLLVGHERMQHGLYRCVLIIDCLLEEVLTFINELWLLKKKENDKMDIFCSGIA